MRIKPVLFAFFIASLGFSGEAGAQFPSFADLAEKLTPSVVNISSFSQSETENGEGNTPLSESLGSGFIIDGNGYIITNNHVVDKAESISITLSDDTKTEARVIGKDPKTDLALIKIETKRPLNAVKFGDSDKIRVGDWVLAIGNPFGLGSSVTAGIVSAKSRDIESGPYDSFIQTDASINQGNSGGPMFNLQGEVIGISSAIFSTTGASQGVGFAIPANLAGWVISQLKEHGEVKRGWIGIKIQPNTPEIADSLGISANQGVVVSGVTEQGPAQKAGLQAGDIVLSFNRQPIDNTKNLSRLIAETKIGTPAPIEIWRSGQKQTLTVPIELMPEETPLSAAKETASDAAETPDNGESLNIIGFTVKEISPELAERYKLAPSTSGVVVTDILPNSDASRKGIKIGDIIVKIDKRNIIGESAFHEYVNDARRENNRPVLLAIQGQEALHFVAVKLMSHD
ncbi:MAG TPA: Do family serine endopeptidase [Candidatus Scatocola faecipullorum]|uniref:Probable periplasmic serine endoprotease DegP-like n=1 Tax=Candidatus Scatocola faecipullorum TaxID=2840917 RepID=A0A9D1SA71_9PROT|nr:Do family serine endopeptidase [Candidatus Scatocola faecipullorum]